MAREIDEKKTRKALRKLRKAKERAEAEDGPGLSDWEREFVDGVEERLETYGSAFNDPEKGALDDALSARQALIVRQIDKKAKKPLKRSSFKPKSKSGKNIPQHTPRVRDIHEDAPPPPVAPPSVQLKAVPPSDAAPATTNSDDDRPPVRQPNLRVIKGGQS